MTFYERIEELRKKRKISQGNLEKELGFSNGSYSKWKNSIPTHERLQKLADYFGVSVEYLTTGKDDRLSERNVDVDFMLLTDDDSREVLIEYKTLDKDRKEMLKKYLEFLKNDMK